MSDWVEYVKRFFVNRFLENYTESYRSHQDEQSARRFGFSNGVRSSATLAPQKLPPIPEYQRLNLRDEESRVGIPQSVLDAYGFYLNSVEDQDWGSVAAFKAKIKERDIFVIHVTTDGDDGWLEIFAQDGQCVGAARTYLELIAWGDTDSIRAYTEDSGFPPELNNREAMTLWGK